MRKIDFKFIEFCKKQKGSIDGGLRKKIKLKIHYSLLSLSI